MMQTDEMDVLVSELDRRANRALQMARDAGAEARVCATVALETRLAGDSDQPHQTNRIENATLEILVSKDDRTGFAVVNGFDPVSLRDAVTSALLLARFSLPDPSPTLATPQQAPTARPLGFQCDPISSMTFGEFRMVIAEAAAGITRDPRVLLERYEGEISVTWRTVRNTLGIIQTEKRTSASWNFLGAARDHEEATGSDYEANFSFRHADLARKCTDSADSLRQRLIGALTARQPSSYNGPVLLAPRAVHDVLTGTIVHHASGREVMDGTSRWADLIGTQVAAASCTLTENPHDERFSAATAFDGDGVPTQTTVIVKDGVFASHLHDVVSAARLSGPTTGHANRALCLEMAQGPCPLSDMLVASPRLLMVHRFAGKVDPISGHYSGIAKLSRFYLNGEDMGSATETMIAGDLLDLITGILAVSRESENVHGEYEAPYVLIDNACVTAG
jgi:PmbA protein